MPVVRTSLEDSSSWCSPRLRPHLPSQTRSHEVLPQGRATSTCCTTVSVLGVSHPLDGSTLGWLVHVAALPDEIRSVSHCCSSSAVPRDTTRASGTPSPTPVTRGGFWDPAVLETLTPLEECIYRTAGSTHADDRSSATRLDTSRYPPFPPWCCAQRVLFSPLSVERSTLTFEVWLRPEDRAAGRHCCLGPTPSPSMGFWFPFEALSPASAGAHHTRDGSDPVSFALAGWETSVRLQASPAANGGVPPWGFRRQRTADAPFRRLGCPALWVGHRLPGRRGASLGFSTSKNG